MKKFGIAERLDIMVFPFLTSFRIDEFAHQMQHRTVHLFMANRGIEDKIFVAATQIDPETRKPPMTLSVITPRWESASAEQIEEDVREYLSRCKGIVVGSAFEEDDYVFVEIETKGRRWHVYRARIVRDDEGQRQICRFEPASIRATLPLLPADKSDLQ